MRGTRAERTMRGTRAERTMRGTRAERTMRGTRAESTTCRGVRSARSRPESAARLTVVARDVARAITVETNAGYMPSWAPSNLLQHKTEGAPHELVAGNVKAGYGLGYRCPDDLESVGRIAERRTQWRRVTG